MTLLLCADLRICFPCVFLVSLLCLQMLQDGEFSVLCCSHVWIWV
jgi:hypothetical protein